MRLLIDEFVLRERYVEKKSRSFCITPIGGIFRKKPLTIECFVAKGFDSREFSEKNS